MNTNELFELYTKETGIVESEINIHEFEIWAWEKFLNNEI